MRKPLWLLLLAGCTPPPPAGPPLGHVSRPYTAIPQYLAHPVADRGLSPKEKDVRITQLLRTIDAHAGALETPQAQCALKEDIAELNDVVPPKRDLQGPIDDMQQAVDALPRTTPDSTRRRLWSLTDLVRMRTHL